MKKKDTAESNFASHMHYIRRHDDRGVGAVIYRIVLRHITTATRHPLFQKQLPSHPRLFFYVNTQPISISPTHLQQNKNFKILGRLPSRSTRFMTHTGLTSQWGRVCVVDRFQPDAYGESKAGALTRSAFQRTPAKMFLQKIRSARQEAWYPIALCHVICLMRKLAVSLIWWLIRFARLTF